MDYNPVLVSDGKYWVKSFSSLSFLDYGDLFISDYQYKIYIFASDVCSIASISTFKTPLLDLFISQDCHVYLANLYLLVPFLIFSGIL